METAPEADDFVASGRGFGEPHRGLDGFGAARVELRAVQITGRELRDQLDQRGAMLRGEAAHVDALELLCHLCHVARMGVAEAGDADAGEKVDVPVAVDVPQHRAFAAIHEQLAEESNTLRAGREVLRLQVKDTV